MCFDDPENDWYENTERWLLHIELNRYPKYDYMTHVVVQNSEVVFDGSLKQCHEYIENYGNRT